MIFVEPSYEILTPISEGGVDELRRIEDAARTCYKSVNEQNDIEKTKRMVSSLIKSGHEAMIEHSQLSVRFICDRAIANEIVRHRLFSFAQESTRYCNYSKEKFGGDVSVIMPSKINDEREKGSVAWGVWASSIVNACRSYQCLIEEGVKPEIARSVLPLCTKTELVVTGNYREWRAFFKLRIMPDAHPDIRNLTIPLLYLLHNKIPVIFDDLVSTYEKLVAGGLPMTGVATTSDVGL